MTSSTATDRQVIPHPVWCREVPDDAPLIGVPVCSADFYSRLAPAEVADEHRGRLYRLEAGECFSGSIEVRVVQTFEFALDDGEHLAHTAQVSLTTNDEDNVGTPTTVYLSPAEVDRLCAMLQRAKFELGLDDRG